jgi:hypothetical protein
MKIGSQNFVWFPRHVTRVKCERRFADSALARDQNVLRLAVPCLDQSADSSLDLIHSALEIVRIDGLVNHYQNTHW